MDRDPFVAVGGDAAGLSAASKLRRETDREAVVLERGRWVSYAHCGMPYYVKGEVETLDAMTSLSPAEIETRGVDLRRGHEATALDTERQVLTVRADGETYEQPYDDLLVATGARAARGPFDTDLDGAFTLHHMDTAAALRAYLTGEREDDERVDAEYVGRYAAMDPPETAAVVGGGYVGVETTEALSAHGLDVYLFQRPDRPLPGFGDAVGDRVAETLREEGVTVHLDTAVEGLRGDGGALAGVEYEGGSLETGLAVVGVGVRPNVEWLDGALDLGESGAVRVDRYGRTSASDVYAAGDCAEAWHAVSGEPGWMPLGLTANRAGRAIGRTVAGVPTPAGEIAGTAAVKAFDLEAARTGLLPEAAREAGFDPVTETVTAGSRSGYYPGATETTVTLVADRGTGRLLGGSIVGADRAAVRIDTVATAVEAGLTVSEVERLDLAYAPPFSPVWDPVLVAAKVLGGEL
jgi:NADPH-dependent 2,4-dienoyl-CoA reductase/sulfur reductase-like enzyme